MHENPAPFNNLSPRRRSAINNWALTVLSSHPLMAPEVIVIPDSNEERESRRSHTSTSASQKRQRSKSPAPTQNKRPKSRSAQEQDGSNKSTSSKKSKKSNAGLTLEERTTKNAVSRLTTMEKRQAAPAKKELAATIERIKESKSPAYKTFELPKLIKPRVKGNPVRYHGFVCKTCREVIQRLVGTMETSALLKHQNRCELHKHQGKLSEYGITGGSAPPTMYDVRQYVVQWVSEDGRPFQIIYDRYLRKLFPLEIVNLLPSRQTIVKDISTVYRMMQNVIRTMLADISGVFHIALDMYQSPNGHDYLGVVLFVPAVTDNVMYIDRFVLECLSFGGKHTGLALANTLHGILQKFGIQDCKFKMKRLTGPEARIHCLPHILNLASKAIAAPFLNQRSELEKAPQVVERDELDDFGRLSEDEEDDEREADDGSASVEEDFDPNEEDETGEDDGTAPSRALDPDDDLDDDLSDIEIPELIAGSIDAKALKSARRALYKIARLARKLRFSPRFRKMFQELCEQLELVGPFNIQRDVVTRWNSTKSMIEDALRLEEAILQYQKNPEYPESLCLTAKDFKAMKILLRLLKPLSVLTEIMSKSKIPMLADVLVHYDSLNREYCDMALDKSLPRWAQQSANCARLKLDKYYNLTDTSYMYRLATILHPSNREAYMKRLSWKPEWIAEARRITLGTWEEHYKPADYEHGGDDASSQSQFGYSSFADEVYGSFAEENDKPVDPVIDFIEGKPILERSKTGRSKPVNPLNWWYAKRLAGEEHDGLTQMALDVLTAPASSVEVERAFSFVSGLVTKHRHCMSSYTIQSTATLGAYSRADLVPAGILAKAHRKARERTQANARAKAANAKAKAAEAEAAAIAAEQERSEDEVTEGGETEDDEDVLEPSSDVEDIDLEDD